VCFPSANGVFVYTFFCSEFLFKTNYEVGNCTQMLAVLQTGFIKFSYPSVDCRNKHQTILNLGVFFPSFFSMTKIYRVNGVKAVHKICAIICFR